MASSRVLAAIGQDDGVLVVDQEPLVVLPPELDLLTT
jgi:hypothetical protein